MPRRAATVLVVSVFAAAAVAAAQAPAWRVAEGRVVVRCPLTVGGSFEARTTSLSGQLAAGGADASRLSGELAVDLRALDTGIGLRNTHLRDNYLEVGKGEGFERAVLTDIALAAGDAAVADGRTGFTGTLLLHGTRRPVAGEARIRRSATEVRVEATFPVRLPEFGIPEPRYLGVGVRDEVRVTVTFAATPATAAESR